MRLLNLGCGGTYHPDWVNVDRGGGVDIRIHDLLEPLPFSDDEFDVVYHSHLLEHLPKRYAALFLKECWRVLKPRGILRVVVPDLAEICLAYLENFQAALDGDEEAAKRYDWMIIELIDQLSRHRRGGEMLEYWKQSPMPAEEFVISRLGDEVRKNLGRLRASRSVGPPFPREQDAGLVGKFRLGGQPHLWMYDEFSLRRLLQRVGFPEIRRYEAGESQIPRFNSYQLDTDAEGRTRKPDSLFLEAKSECYEVPKIPLVLLLYNRPDKVEQLVAALAVFRPSPLYVFLDGAKRPEDVQLVEECRQLVVTHINWTEPTLIQRRNNWGLAKSTVSAVDDVLTEYDKIVVLEDDCIPGPHFMEFMRLCLNKYEKVPQIMSVTGYTFPVPQSIRNNYPWDVYFLQRIGGWGWGTWRRAWEHRISNLQVGYNEATRLGVDLGQCGKDMELYIEMQLKKPRDIWTPNWALAHYLRGAYCVYPTTSHVQNIGHDGTGVNCRVTEMYNVTIATELRTRLPDYPVVSKIMLNNYKRQSIGG